MDSADNTTSLLVGALPLLDGININNTYGATLLGTFFGMILYGILIHQTYHYFRVHYTDNSWIKSYVVLIFFLDTVQSVVNVALCYLKLVTYYSNPLYLITMDWPLNLVTLVSALNVVTCESFFAYRVYQISRSLKSRTVVWLCTACQCAGMGLCIVVTAKFFRAELRQTILSSTIPLLSVALGLTALVDTVLGAVLVVCLHRSRTGVKETNSLLDTLIAYSLTTGLLTDLFNILGFVFALASSQSLYYAATDILVTRVYTNSVMAALNFRRPREPVGNQCLSTFSDMRIAHHSLYELSQSSERARQPSAKGISDATGHSPSLPMEIIDIKAEDGSSGGSTYYVPYEGSLGV